MCGGMMPGIGGAAGGIPAPSREPRSKNPADESMSKACRRHLEDREARNSHFKTGFILGGYGCRFYKNLMREGQARGACGQGLQGRKCPKGIHPEFLPSPSPRKGGTGRGAKSRTLRACPHHKSSAPLGDGRGKINDARRAFLFLLGVAGSLAAGDGRGKKDKGSDRRKKGTALGARAGRGVRDAGSGGAVCGRCGRGLAGLFPCVDGVLWGGARGCPANRSRESAHRRHGAGTESRAGTL